MSTVWDYGKCMNMFACQQFPVSMLLLKPPMARTAKQPTILKTTLYCGPAFWFCGGGVRIDWWGISWYFFSFFGSELFKKKLINPTTCNAARLTLEPEDAHAHLMLTETDFQVNLPMDVQRPSHDLSFCGIIGPWTKDQRNRFRSFSAERNTNFGLSATIPKAHGLSLGSFRVQKMTNRIAKYFNETHETHGFQLKRNEEWSRIIKIKGNERISRVS